MSIQALKVSIFLCNFFSFLFNPNTRAFTSLLPFILLPFCGCVLFLVCAHPGVRKAPGCETLSRKEAETLHASVKSLPKRAVVFSFQTKLVRIKRPLCCPVVLKNIQLILIKYYSALAHIAESLSCHGMPFAVTFFK